jgi:imidazolonepropionase-like amidohydrolase
MRIPRSARLASVLAIVMMPVTRDGVGVKTAFIGVTVLDMVHPAPQTDQTVLVEGGRITALGPSRTMAIPPDARRIDGRGRFLMPGLADMHVHLQDSSDLRLFIAAGVTTIRDLNGSPSLLVWRRLQAHDSLTAPALIVSGPIFAGPEIRWKNKVVPHTPAEAREMVLAQHRAGYDVIKIYDGLTRDIYDTIMATAARVGMPVTGHIPDAVGLAGVLAAHQSLEHADKILYAVWGDSIDDTRVPAIADSVKRSGVWFTATLASLEQLDLVSHGRFDSLMGQPGVRQSSKDARDWWDIVGRMAGQGNPTAGRFTPYTEFMGRLVRALFNHGVPMLAGTDTPNAVMVPGYSLLDELEALQDDSIPAYAVLLMATRNPGEWAKAIPSFGTITVGARADLLLLSADPSHDVRNLRRRVGVMTRGRWLGEPELDAMAGRD